MQPIIQFLPKDAFPYIEKWKGNYNVEIKITKNRNSKLGDYRKIANENHRITINSTLNPELFFLVLTHELAHLIAFETFGRTIAPHGKEWKKVFGDMILESLSIYAEEAKSMLMKFSKSPKANFMASEDLVRYFRPQQEHSDSVYVENLSVGDYFSYRENIYQYIGKMRKNHLCEQQKTKKKYLFKGVTMVEMKK